jgi:uncharacterized protein YndB with AHSA1/START domain
MSELSMTVSKTMNVPIESVFKAWLDPEMLGKFMMPGEGMTIPKVETDAREGGRFSIIMKGKDGEYPHGGEYKKIEPFTRIVFTWESEFSPEGSTVTVQLSETDEGTHVELTHVKFLDEERRSNHEGGWTMILTHLDQVLTQQLN